MTFGKPCWSFLGPGLLRVPSWSQSETWCSFLSCILQAKIAMLPSTNTSFLTLKMSHHARDDRWSKDYNLLIVARSKVTQVTGLEPYPLSFFLEWKCSRFVAQTWTSVSLSGQAEHLLFRSVSQRPKNQTVQMRWVDDTFPKYLLYEHHNTFLSQYTIAYKFKKITQAGANASLFYFHKILKFREHRNIWYDGLRVSWTVAHAACRRTAGHLLHLISRSQQDEVIAVLKSVVHQPIEALYIRLVSNRKVSFVVPCLCC